MNNGDKLSYKRISWKKIGLRRCKTFVTDKVLKQRTMDYPFKYFAKNRE